MEIISRREVESRANSDGFIWVEDNIASNIDIINNLGKKVAFIYAVDINMDIYYTRIYEIVTVIDKNDPFNKTEKNIRFISFEYLACHSISAENVKVVDSLTGEILNKRGEK
ncbi:MAG: hypothetical protein WC554_13870 [Clostridia bacterium]|jgi:hypothetical protein